MQRDAVEHGFDVGGHVVRPLHVVYPGSIRRRKALERGGEIGADIRVGVLLNDKRGRGVAHEKQQSAVARLDPLEELLRLARDLEKTFAGGLDASVAVAIASIRAV
jgi:hypothetical protein